MEIQKSGANSFKIKLGDHEMRSLSHCAGLADQSTDNLLVHAFKATVALIVFSSQLKEAYDKLYE